MNERNTGKAANSALVGSIFGAAADAELAAQADVEQALISAYESTGRTLDALPYTAEFETLFTKVAPFLPPNTTRRDLFHRLHNLRKAGKMPRLGRADVTVIRVSAEDESLLASLVIERVGTLGQRDQLPFDPRIDDVAQVFNARTGRSLSQSDVWRLIAKIAK